MVLFENMDGVCMEYAWFLSKILKVLVSWAVSENPSRFPFKALKTFSEHFILSVLAFIHLVHRAWSWAAAIIDSLFPYAKPNASHSHDIGPEVSATEPENISWTHLLFQFSCFWSLLFFSNSFFPIEVSAKILSQKNGEHFSKKVPMNHFGFSPMYSYSIELKTPKRGQLNVNEKKIMTDFPRTPGSFPWPYVTLIFTCEIFRIYCGSKLCVFFLLVKR